MHITKCLTICVLIASTAPAWADGGGVTALLPKMEKECSSCHIAFRPNFLPRSSWKQVMASLDKHYGTDASLSDADNAEITTWLDKTSQEVGDAPPNNRITESFWFKRKHGTNHVKAEVWSRASVKSRANCQACHVNADKGDFNEHNIKIPR
ncbi:MAG: cytochrome C [Rhodoferax sp.]|nr:cytochrome C [Rhodoferax sp.]